VFLFIWTSVNEAILKPTFKQRASFLNAYEMIKSYEGGYANITNDIGEETYCGISRKFFKDWDGWYHIDEYKRTKGIPEWNHYFNDITEWYVIEFYVELWVKEGFFDLENQEVANYLFDFRIHSVIGVRIIQQQLNEYGYHFELNNQMNPAMVMALNKIDSKVFLKSIMEKRIDFYKQIADRDPSQQKFLPHWLKRASV